MSTTAGPMARREAKLAYSMLLPTIFVVLAIVLLPLAATFWISVKPVTLNDLRAPEATAKARLRGSLEAAGDSAILEFRLRNTSQQKPVSDITFKATMPTGITITEVDPRCQYAAPDLSCDFDDFPAKFSERLKIPVTADASYIKNPVPLKSITPLMSGTSDNVLTNFSFTTSNFTKIFDSESFWHVLWVTMVYTFAGTIGALIMGLFAAQLLQREFKGRTVVRGLFLFPYVAPVIAMAFTWLVLFDPYSGVVNALLKQMGVVSESINFFGIRDTPIDLFGMEFQFPVALSMVIAFEIWRYFPLAFMFIMARMQSIPTDMYEAAEMDGASPLQQFWSLSLPQLAGILAVLFLLRFIWTFNKFDDIFLLTGGNAGTRTLTVDVYEQAFALSNLGAGSAVAVVIFVLLLIMSLLYFRSIPKEEGL
ncbi:carbohydrate ABC transporter permease [Leucothrix arctica]|nr:sugar ABC transporter permease [Leucothrix arctica]